MLVAATFAHDEADGAVLARGRFRAAPAHAGRFTFAVVGDFGSGNRNETAVASLITAYTGLYFIFNGQASGN